LATVNILDAAVGNFHAPDKESNRQPPKSTKTLGQYVQSYLMRAGNSSFVSGKNVSMLAYKESQKVLRCLSLLLLRFTSRMNKDDSHQCA
jgi:hypothetical protein